MKKIQLLLGVLFWVNLSFAQNVGIGTPTPDYTLDVNGSLGINDAIYHNDDPDTWMGFPAPDTWELNVGGKRATQVDAINSTLTVNPDNDDIDFLIRSDGINALLYADTNNDHIGIGTSTPQHLVDIDNGNMLIRGDGINALMYADHDDSRIGIGTATPQHLVDIDNGNMLIRGDGINALMYADHDDSRIGIGTSTPQHLVDIDNGNMLIRGDGINALMYADHDDSRIGIGTSTPQHLVDIDNGNMLIRGDGINALLFVDHFDDKVGIGTDTPQTELHVVGTIKADSLELNSSQLPIIKYGKVLRGPYNNTFQADVFTINYSGFTAPPTIFITVDDSDTVGSIDAAYAHSVRNVTSTSAEIHIEENGDGLIYGTFIVNWMAME